MSELRDSKPMPGMSGGAASPSTILAPSLGRVERPQYLLSAITDELQASPLDSIVFSITAIAV